MTFQEAQDMLEQIIDQHGRAGVQDMLVHIAHLKAEHIRCNWQDSITAREWDAFARRIERTTTWGV